MPSVTFASFTLEASPAVTDYLVGYRTDVAGGERRTTISSLATVLGTVLPASIAGTANQITASASVGAVTLSLAGPHDFTSLTSTAVLLGAGTSAITPADLTYVSPTLSVPDAFVVSSAGSIGLTAGGSNKNITLTPSGTGWVNVGSVTSSTAVVAPLLQASQEASGSSIFPSLEIVGYQNGQTTQVFNVVAKAGGTAASPSNASANATLGGYRAYAYANGAFRPAGGVNIATSPTFGSSDFSTTVGLSVSTSSGILNIIDSAGGSGSTGIAKGMTFGGLAVATGAATTMFYFDATGGFSRSAAWGTTGANSAWIGRTITDTVSSGTVATAVANSFAVPTFAASSATTFTNAANLYIAGDVAQGTNVTLTNSYGLWNAGKTRLDGAVVLPSTNTAGLQLYNTADQTTNYERLEALWISNQALFRTIAGGSGQTRSVTIASRAATGFQASLVIGRASSSLFGFDFTGTHNAAAPTYSFRSTGTMTQTSGTIGYLSIEPTYNQASGTAANDDLKIARTETAVGSGVQNFINCLGGAAGTTQRAALNSLGYLALGSVTPTLTTALHTPAATTGISSIRLPHGAAPSAPVDGDMWTTTAGLFVRINGATVGPLS